MARPTVSANSKQYGTKGPDDWNREISSPSSANGIGMNGLSFLHGATVDGGSNDMGPSSDWNAWNMDGWEAKRALRRHTVEPGMSTFARPAKR